jgi:hypothetical protein
MTELTKTAAVYALVRSLPRLNHEARSPDLPPNGIYLFFERGETVKREGQTYDRIVRIGTHRQDGRFPARIRQHYGHVFSLRGNKNSSVFRKHLGGALMRRVDTSDQRIGPWLIQGGPSFPEVEESVSRLLRECFTFACFRVDLREDRMLLESGLIALLAQHPLGQPSEDWLGHHAASEEIRRTGLWNTQRVDAVPLTDEEVQRFERLVQAALA